MATVNINGFQDNKKTRQAYHYPQWDNNEPKMKQFEKDESRTNNSLLPGNLRREAPKTCPLVEISRTLL